MGVRVLLLVLLIVISNFSMAAEGCEDKHAKVFAELQYAEGQVDTSMYGEVPNLLTFGQLDDQASVLKKIADKNGATGWYVNVTCVDAEAVYFSMSIAGHINKYFNGVIVFKNQKYFAGPLSFLPEDTLIIQTEDLKN